MKKYLMAVVLFFCGALATFHTTFAGEDVTVHAAADLSVEAEVVESTGDDTSVGESLLNEAKKLKTAASEKWIAAREWLDNYYGQGQESAEVTTSDTDSPPSTEDQ